MSAQGNLKGRAVAILIGAVLSTACDEDGVGTPDTGDDGAEVSQALGFADRPELGPCPEGWREVEHDAGVMMCDPWPEGGPIECDLVDSAHFLGEAGCTQLGESCPEGDWSEDLPPDAPIVFVREGADGVGAGSREDPFGTLSEAVDAAQPGAVIAIAKGRYDERVVITTDVSLWGACVAETVLGISGASFDPFWANLSIEGGADVSVRNLQISGGNAGVFVASDTSVELTDVVMVDILRAGVISNPDSENIRVVARNIILHDFRGEQLTERGAVGFSLLGANGSFELERAVLADLSTAISLFDSQVEIRDVAILDLIEMSGLGGLESSGIGVFDGTTGSVRRVYVSSVATYAFFASGGGTDVILEDLVTVADPTLANGPSIIIHDGATAEISDIWVDGHYRSGIQIVGGIAELSDVLIENTDGAEVAAGLTIIGAAVNAERILLADNRGTGVALGDLGVLDAVDVIVTETGALQCDPEDACQNGPLGMGITIQGGAVITLAEFELTAAALCGFQLVEGDATLSDGIVSGNPIGANIQRGDFDYSQIASTVFFVDNERNLDSYALPVPDLSSLSQVFQ